MITTQTLGPPAPESDYSQFAETDIPPGSGASKAYRGYVRPFSDDETARQVLRALEANLPLTVSAGRLHASASHLPKHPVEGFLLDMALPCTVIVLEFPGTEHRRAFLIDPGLVPRFSQNPHVRIDKSICFNGRMHPALCVYSGNLFRYQGDRTRLEQFLDQTATYLAKHLIWLRTRMLLCRAYGSVAANVVRRRKPNETVTQMELILSPHVYWEGYWPGVSAPAGPMQHLATIKPKDECWCWSGKLYGDCCRPKEMAYSRGQSRNCESGV